MNSPNRRTIIVGSAAAAVTGIAAATVGYRRLTSMTDYDAAVAETRARLSENPAMADLVRIATLAPNGHNTQPWRFAVSADSIAIRADAARRTPVVDPDDHHVFVSLGAAAENLALAASASGRPPEVTFDGEAITVALGQGRRTTSPLFDAIPRRQSTRGLYDDRQIASEHLKLLAASAATPGVDLALLTDRAAVDRVRDLVVAGNSAQLADPAFLAELKHWLRFNPAQALATRDGLYSAASGSPTLPNWLGPLMFDRGFTPAADNDKYAQQLRSSSGVAVFVGAKADRAHWVEVGRACQRFALQATVLGMKCAFVNQPVEVAALRPDLAGLVGMPGRRPDIVMRFGYGAALPFSQRRPPRSVIG